MNVANSAVELAKRYGADADKAYIAGLLHDVAKEIPALELAAIVSKSSLDVCDIEKKAVPLFHGIAGAELVQTLFDIHDPEIISAIRYHTVACGNMPKLSQIVYLADLISADRDYKDVKKMRKYAEQSLEKAMFEALKFSIKDSVERVILSLFPHLKHIMILPIIQNKGDFMDNISQNEKLSTIVKALDSKRQRTSG